MVRRYAGGDASRPGAAAGMIVIGLTGGIAMGKSTVAAQFASLGVKTCSADAIVHTLLGPNGAGVELVRAAFPSAWKEGRIDRKLLGAQVFGNQAALERLEAILHPLVVAEENRFVERERRKGAKVALLDIPLLFETNAHHRFDVTVAVTAPRFLQHLRVMKRPGMTRERLDAILARQLSDDMRRRRADFVIHTG